jgi:di/tricarboxylate transporter
MFVVLAAMTALTILLSMFINNVATAVIVAPLGIAVARTLGIDIDAMLIAILIGTSADFLTPIGHQNNVLVMGPGGYKFTDYARMGAPLVVIVVAGSAALLTAFYG